MPSRQPAATKQKATDFENSKNDLSTPIEASNGEHEPTARIHHLKGKGRKRLNLMDILLAFLSFCGGILTPPLLRHKRVVEQASKVMRRISRATMDGKTQFICDKKTLNNYLHDFSVAGMHIVCFNDSKLTYYKDAQRTQSPKTRIVGSINDWDAMRQILAHDLDLSSTDDLHQPWTSFSPTGERLLSEVDMGTIPIDGLAQLGIFFVFQGGQWIWPGVHKGFQRQIQLDDERNATLETLSLHPLVLSVKGFLSDFECTRIQEQATPSMKYSQVTLMDKDKGRPASDFRTSQTTFLRSLGSPYLQEIEQRTSSLVRIPISHQEHVQVLRYGHSEKYDTHHDYFEPSLYQKDKGTLALIQNGRRNRMITVFWYLSDVVEGGETVFPRFDKSFPPPKRRSCETGLRVKPEAGKVIIFYSQTPDGKLDPYSLHGACPVKEGVKWAANKWVWNAPINYVD